jgi:hypothetical protein
MRLAREFPEMDHPLLAAYRAPSYSLSVMAKAGAAQALYESLPVVCPDCGNDDAESLSAGTSRAGKPAWVCSNEEACIERAEMYEAAKNETSCA